MILFDRDKNIFYSTKINDGSYISGFGVKPNGDGRQIDTILNLAQKNNLEQQTVVRLEQTHSTNIHILSAQSTDSETVINNCDGIISSLKKNLLTVLTADCVPLLLIDRTSGLIGASHQGWKGTIAKMSANLVAEMQLRGAVKDTMYAAIGPCIGMCCYEVYGERLEQYEQRFGTYKDKILRKTDQKTHLNLLAANYYSLVEAGINENNIDFFPFCTACDEKKFYSYRRDGEIKGEMVSYIMKV